MIPQGVLHFFVKHFFTQETVNVLVDDVFNTIFALPAMQMFTTFNNDTVKGAIKNAIFEWIQGL